MILDRVDGEMKINKECERIEIILNGVKYSITESFGKINVLSHGDRITVSPCYANSIDFV